MVSGHAPREVTFSEKMNYLGTSGDLDKVGQYQEKSTFRYRFLGSEYPISHLNLDVPGK